MLFRDGRTRLICTVPAAFSGVPLNAVQALSRWAALPLVTALAVPLLTALPAAAATRGEWHGYLSESDFGTRYVVQGDTYSFVFTSPYGAVDGAVARWTDAGPTVLYVSEEDTATSYVDRLHVVPPGGTDTVVYTAPAGTDLSEPSLSADGSTALFALDTDDTSAIVAVDTGSQAARTIRSSTSTVYFGPSFSPDASYLSWAQQTPSGSDVVVTRYANGAASVVEHSSTDDFSDTAWSPDGTRLAVERDDDQGPSLEILDLSTGSSRVLLHGTTAADGSVHGYAEPSWAEGGAALYVSKVTLTSTGSGAALMRVDASTGGESVIGNSGFAGAPSVAGPTTTDSAAPTLTMTATPGAAAHLVFSTSDTDIAEFIVTRSAGEPSDTPTADIEVGRTRALSFDVPLPAPDTTYGISVFARDWSGNLSPAAKATVTSTGPSAITVSTPPARISWRAGVKLTGILSSSAGPLAGQKVVLYARRAMTSTAVAVASATTDANGAYALGYVPQWTAEYQVRFAGGQAAYAVQSAKRVVTVVPAVNLSVSAYRIRLGGTVTLTGSFGPNHAGQSVVIQRRVNGVWRNLATARLSTTSTYRLVLKPNARGTWELRTYKSADGDHAATSGPVRTVSVY